MSTVSDNHQRSPLIHVQLVTFSLQGISEAELRAAFEAVAPEFAALPGLRSKVWLAERTSNTYGGIYTWQDRAAMQAYLYGELYAAVRDNPPSRASARATSACTPTQPASRAGPSRPRREAHEGGTLLA